MLVVVIDQQQRGSGVVQRVDDLRQAPAVVHRVDHRIGPGHRQVVLDVAQRVGRKHGHAVTAGDPQLLQCAGQAGDAIAELGVGDAAVQVTDGRGMRSLLKVAVQTLGDVHAKLQFLLLCQALYRDSASSTLGC
ncbi:hypothetical protein D9M71_560470 [compost metagenome]